MSRNKKSNSIGKQGMIWNAERKPATEIMKTVATKTLDVKQMEKNLTAEKIREVLARRDVCSTGCCFKEIGKI